MAESPRRAGAILITAVLVAGVFFIVANIANWGPFKGLGGEPYTQVGPTVVESVRDVAKLTTVEMVEYTTVEKGNDFGWLNWARGDRIFLFAVARIGGGVDMEKVTTSNFVVDEGTELLWRLRALHSGRDAMADVAVQADGFSIVAALVCLR